MLSSDRVKSTALIVYVPPQPFHVKVQAHMEKIQNLFMESSFKAQMADCHLSAVTVRALVLAGAMPSPQMGPGLPKRFPGTMADLLDGVREGEPCTVKETVNRTMNAISYNGLQPFNKTAKQISDGRSFLETKIDSRGEEDTGSTCIGMSYALLKQLADHHGIEGTFTARREIGKAFQHAGVIVECTDGYVLLDPRNHPDYRIYPIPFNTTVTINDNIFTASNPGSQIPISEINYCDGEFEYCTNIANADDLVTKNFMMKAPFNPSENPAFPISAYYHEGEKAGRSSRTIWVSPLQAKFTFKNDTVESGPERTIIISFNDALKDSFHAQLKRFVAGTPPTFNIDVELLRKQLIQFVTNASIFDEMFREIYSKK